ERIDDGPHHADAEGQGFGRRRLLHLIAEKIEPDWVPARAAPLLRPMRHRPPLLVEDTLPVDQIGLRKAAALDHFAPRRLRYAVTHEGARLVAKGDFLGREAKVHDVGL